MTQKDFTHWIESIYATQDHEIDCQQFQNHLPAFIEAEWQNNPLPHTAVLNTHLRQCPDCQEIYDGLRLVIQAEAELQNPISPGTTAVSPLPTGD